MLSRFQRRALSVAGVLAFAYACGEMAAKRMTAPSPASAVETGVHWAGPVDFAQLERLGHQFAVISLDREPDHWREVFDAAEKSGIRLIAGLHPYPYRLEHGKWEIEAAGRQFLDYAQTRSGLMKALFVFHEPYWVDPNTGANAPCGAYSAVELRALRTEIQRIWPRALIYHDFGRPSLWSPGGSMERDHRCVGSRYADVGGVTDYAGIWFFRATRETATAAKSSCGRCAMKSLM